jgi:hypothetical protein
MAIRPEDILPEDINAIEINNIAVRKGTVAAALANAKILASNTASHIEKAKALELIKELAPSLVAMETHRHLTWNNSEIQKIIEETAKK